MCASCQQLENDVQRYRDFLEHGGDALSPEVQLGRKLHALGVDPLTAGLINAAIEKLVQGKPADARTKRLAALWAGTDLSSRRHAAAGHLTQSVH